MEKILVVTRSFDQQIGGMETHTLLIVKHFLARGYSVTVVTPHIHDGNAPLFTLKGLIIKRISSPPNDLLKYSLKFLVAIRNFIERHGYEYEHIISVSMAAGFVTRRLTNKKNIQITTVLHGTYHLEQQSLISQFFNTRNKNIKTLLGIPYCAIMKILQWNIVVCSSKIISASTIITKDLNKCYDKKYTNNITTVKNFINEKHFGFIERFNRSRTELKLLYAGRLHKEKGIDMIIKLVGFLEHLNIPYHLDIVGDGAMLKQVETSFKDNQKVNLVGKVSNKKVAIYLKEADIFLFPTKITGEGMSLSLLEAMSTGMIVITSDIPSMIELLDDKKDGLLFKLGDQKDFNNKVLWCIKNIDQLKNISHIARKKIVTDHSLLKGLNIIEKAITE